MTEPAGTDGRPGAVGVRAGMRPAAPAPPFHFSPAGPAGDAGRDELDAAVVAAARAHGGAECGLWRCWRYPVGPLAGGEHRVYIAQAAASAVPALAAGLRAAIAARGGEASAEVVALGTKLPPYQRAALDRAGLLWATVSGPEFEVAAVFDFDDPVSGPGFARDHAVVDDPRERQLLLGYLGGGTPVLTTTALLPDVLDPAGPPAAAMTFRTDGDWIWADTTGYYLSRYGLAPDPRLAAHIKTRRAAGRYVPDADQDAAAAAEFLTGLPAGPAAGGPG